MLNESRVVKNIIKVGLTSFCLFLLSFNQPASGQSIKLLASNTLNGAVTGVAMGGATIGLKNTTDYEGPIRVGLGLGTLYGIGVGVYDLSEAEDQTTYYVSATFNDGRNSSIIVLLDTFYGAAAGAVIASAVTLIANDPVVKGLQYGASAGAYAGFGFGLIDAFTLAKEPSELSVSQNAPVQAGGLLSYQSRNNRLGVGLINPSVIRYTDLSSGGISRRVDVSVDVLNLSYRF